MCDAELQQLDLKSANKQRDLLLKGHRRRRNDHIAYESSHARILPPVGNRLLNMVDQVVPHAFVRKNRTIRKHLVPINVIAMGMRIKEVQRPFFRRSCAAARKGIASATAMPESTTSTLPPWLIMPRLQTPLRATLTPGMISCVLKSGIDFTFSQKTAHLSVNVPDEQEKQRTDALSFGRSSANQLPVCSSR